MLGEQPVSGEQVDALITSDIADNTYTILKQFSEEQCPVTKILTLIIRSINPTALAETSKVLLHICFRLWCLKSPCKSYDIPSLAAMFSSIPLSRSSTGDFIILLTPTLTSPITNPAFLQNFDCKAGGPTPFPFPLTLLK
ncbi:hypothetical protein BTUL_0034g00360 [Botrytis tulipae]|uniref:Uncharacterized protein n=1 Tax=Botrytis tulipae TaxID=87230 RepID=A0A4Z1EU22_9HELO|nr:hypothetical protein BTUL_0034g00360 [Botrytis tulipae]